MPRLLSRRDKRPFVKAAPEISSKSKRQQNFETALCYPVGFWEAFARPSSVFHHSGVPVRKEVGVTGWPLNTTCTRLQGDEQQQAGQHQTHNSASCLLKSGHSVCSKTACVVYVP